MDKKNIIFNYTLEQYNKKYRNRRYRLLKYTKKQVEDFDKQYGHYIFNSKTYTLEFNNYLLKDRKWALIGDTYYEIPKPVRYTWFRNLNAGVQAISCLVGVGAVSSAVIFPVLAETVWKKGEDPVEPDPIIVIEGADYDKSASNIKLNKDSYIVLKSKEGKEIKDVIEVKVDGKAISKDTDWSYDKNNNKVEIKAHAMTSIDIEIKVISEDPKPYISRAEFIAKADEWVIGQKGFCNVETKYYQNQLSVKFDGKPIEIGVFYYSGSGQYRFTNVGSDAYLQNQRCIATRKFSGTKLNDILKADTVEGVSFSGNNDYICYEDNNASNGEYSELKLNKFGYIMSHKIVGGENYECTYTGEPHEILSIPVQYDEDSMTLISLNLGPDPGTALTEEVNVEFSLYNYDENSVTFNIIGKINGNEVYKTKNPLTLDAYSEVSHTISASDIEGFSKLSKEDTLTISVEKV